VLNNERAGTYLGKTVQVIPMSRTKSKPHPRPRREIQGGCRHHGNRRHDGDIEGLPFLEAIREFALEVGFNNAIFIHVTYVPFIKAAGN